MLAVSIWAEQRQLHVVNYRLAVACNTLLTKPVVTSQLDCVTIYRLFNWYNNVLVADGTQFACVLQVARGDVAFILELDAHLTAYCAQHLMGFQTTQGCASQIYTWRRVLDRGRGLLFRRLRIVIKLLLES